MGLTDLGLLPAMKHPHKLIGTVVNFPGSHWGSACLARDAKKLFKSTVLDHSLAHRDDPDDDKSTVDIVPKSPYHLLVHRGKSEFN